MHEASAWLSLHLFYHQVEGQDRLLVEAVGPALQALAREGWIERCFFLRYGEGGPHVRVRLRGSRPGWREEAADRVRRDFAAFVERHPSAAGLEPSSFYRQWRELEPRARPERPWYGDHTVQELPYEPEYERYGGPEAMGLSEELFHVGSECALSVLPALLQAPQKRLGVALELMLLGALPWRPLAQALGERMAYHATFLGRLLRQEHGLQEEARALLAKHGERLGPRLASLREDYHQGRLSGSYRRWVEALREASAALEALEATGRLGPARVSEAGLTPQGQERSPALATIGLSNVHMLNNRLGVTLRLEAVLAWLLYHLLERERGAH